jgi:hypothetical protein
MPNLDPNIDRFITTLDQIFTVPPGEIGKFHKQRHKEIMARLEAQKGKKIVREQPRPGTPDHYLQMAQILDDGITALPKYPGTLYRGILVTDDQNRMLSGEALLKLLDNAGIRVGWGMSERVPSSFSYNPVASGFLQYCNLIFQVEMNMSGVDFSGMGPIKYHVTVPSSHEYEIVGIVDRHTLQSTDPICYLRPKEQFVINVREII